MSKKSDSSSLRRSCRQRKALYGSLREYDILFSRPHHGDEHRRLVESSSNMGPSGLRRSFRHSRVLNNHESDEEILDIYSRVKRRKRRVSAPSDRIFDTESPQEESNQSMMVAPRSDIPTKKNEPAEESSSDEEDSGEEQIQRRYFLREQKVAPERFKIDFEPHKKRVEVVVKRSGDYEQRAFQSPAHKRMKHHDYMKRRFKRKLEHAGSSTSSDSDISDDETRFEQRKKKSLDRGRNEFLPANMSPRSKKLGAAVSRQKGLTSAITADLDPMTIDTTIGFEQVGGLTHHLQGLKEMILFPLLYPEIFDKFKISPPRGVLFYGPPGTGKTLVARALANECSKSKENRKVAFFMRKGADCLSKWVGESERQLRLLFDQAYTMRPSIIFFDEIDGLAPVRSSRQDQIHSSIVSTLLALMDGLDQRGEVIVIGATNRLDALDPALRRPGRFDRELLFTLPDSKARTQILKIHTAGWTPPMNDSIIENLAEKLVGYCGADIKGICTEAALVALRRKYPQIYASDKKLLVDPNAVTITVGDFEIAMRISVPSTKRSSMNSVAKQLPLHLKPLLDAHLKNLVTKLNPEFRFHRTSIADNNTSYSNTNAATFGNVLDVLKMKRPFFGQRFLLCADGAENGQSNFLAPALFHQLDHLPVFSLALSQVFSASYRCAEEAVSEIMSTAVKFSPCVLFTPTVDVMLRVLPHSAWFTMASTLQSWSTTVVSVLVLATANEIYSSLDDEIKVLFEEDTCYNVVLPYADARRRFFSYIIQNEVLKEPENSTDTVYEMLPEAAPAPPKPMTSNEVKKFLKLERQILRELRIFLREILNRLIRDRRFVIFSKPVDPEEAPDYETIVETPMDLSTMMSKIDQHKYLNVEAFLADIDLITRNALEYNPDRDQTDKLIRHRACALRDVANALIEQEYDSDFEAQCKEVEEFRKSKNVQAKADVPPAYVHVQPTAIVINGNKNELSEKTSQSSSSLSNQQQGYGNRVASIVKKYKARRQLRLNSSTGDANSLLDASLDAQDCINAMNDGQEKAKLSSPVFAGQSSAATSPTRSHRTVDLLKSTATVLVYDESKINKLIDLAVRHSSDWSLAKLEKIYMAIMHKVDQYTIYNDKTSLIEELDCLVRNFS